MKTVSWQITPDEFRKVIKQLRFEYFKWDAFACGRCLMLPESIVLSRTEHERVVAIAQGLCAALEVVEEKLHQTPELLRRLGIPEALFPIIAAEPSGAMQITRYDLFPTTDGRWLVSEFNEDVPGGFNEAAGLPVLLRGVAGPGKFAGDLRAAVLEAFGDAQRVALMFATGYSEDLQHMLLLESWCEQTGRQSVLCSPEHLEWRRGGFMISGNGIDAVFRFYPGEWIPLLPNLRLWQKRGGELKMMNPLRRMIRQSKLLFALWLEDGILEGPHRDLAEAHAPRAELFRAEKLDDYAAERERRVLKRAFGRMGDSVVMGNLTTPANWRAALDEAAKTPAQFTMQERFVVEPMQFAAGQFFPAIGVYLVNGRFAGYYSRVAPEPFLTHEAYHVATLVEDA